MKWLLELADDAFWLAGAVWAKVRRRQRPLWTDAELHTMRYRKPPGA
jgi:hypothetical protein